MNATGERAAAANDAAGLPSEDLLTPLATGSIEVISAWAALLKLELLLAQRSLRWLPIGAILVPVAALGTWLTLSSLLIALAHLIASSWLLALLLGSGVQLLAIAILLDQMRRWARDLTLPQSRDALVYAIKRMP